MKELSPTARALLEAGREAEESPNARDRARVQARLTALLGASAFGAAASQAAAMASVASGTTAATSGSAGAAAVSVGAATGVGAGAASGGAAANAVGAAAIGAAGAASLGSGAVVSGAATAGVGSAGVAAGGGAAAATGWAATLGAKGVAWISAAALSAAVGTTAVVTRQSDETAHVVAAARSGEPAGRSRSASDQAQPTSDIAAATALTEHAAEPSASSESATARNTHATPQNQAAPNATGTVAPNAARHPGAGLDSQRAARGSEVGSAPKPTSATAAAPSRESVDTGISATRFATLAASAADARRARPSSAPIDIARGQESTADAESDAELLPQPTDPDQMNAVAAAPRDEVRAPQLSATDATVPSHALDPGATPAGVQAKPAAASSGSSHAAASEPEGAAAASGSAAKPTGEAHPGVALAGELQLLAQAQRALHDGKLSLALTLLDQHSAQHAQGSLREERVAARAVVLCRMHQSAAGNAEAQRLAASTPRSPLLPWVRSACAKR
jgi:hypothetical protein